MQQYWCGYVGFVFAPLKKDDESFNRWDTMGVTCCKMTVVLGQLSRLALLCLSVPQKQG